MATLDHIQLLMSEIGPELRPIAVDQHEDDLWSIVFDDATVVSLEYDEERQKLIFERTLGKPDDDRRLATYSALLTYSFLTERTGGVKMALDAMYGNVVQTFELNATDLTLPGLCTVLENFVETSRSWEEVLSRGGVADDDALAGGEFNEMSLGVRV